MNGTLARDPRQLWQAVLAELQLSMSRANFDTYFKDTWALGLEDQALVVGVKNPIIQETLEQRFAGLIRKTLADVTDAAMDVRLVTQGAPAPPGPVTVASSSHARTTAVGSPRAASMANDGPLNTEIVVVTRCAIACAITSLIRACVAGSSPFVVLTIAALFRK